MKLYGHPLSTCTRKVLFAAAEKGRAIDLEAVDLFQGAHKQPAHVAKHPFGLVPVLDHDGFLLYESRAILRYLDDALPGVALTPSTRDARALMDQWLSVDQSYVAPHTKTLAVQRILREHQGLPADPAAIADAERQLSEALGVYDRALEGGEYLVPGGLSLADLSLAPYVAALPMLRAGHLIEPLRNLSAWWERVGARPAWKKVVA